VCAILSPEARAAGFRLVIDDHLICVQRDGLTLLAYTTYAAPSTIRADVEAMLEAEQLEEGGSGEQN